MNLSLAINLCGPMYLVTVWSYWPSAVDSDNLRPAVLGTLSWPFRVSCETGDSTIDLWSFINIKVSHLSYLEVDVSLHLQLPSPSKNITLLPGPTISSQLPGMKLHLVHHNSSKSPVLMARTSLEMPQIWIYLRWQPFAYLNQS
jgi:hypothetical protein